MVRGEEMSRPEPKRILSPQELNRAACDVYFLANEVGVHGRGVRPDARG